MKLKLNVTRHTTPSELIILGALFESLALAREGHVVSVPAEDAGDDPTPASSAGTVVVQVPPTGEDKPKRSRRSKAEIEAEAVAKAEAEAQASNEATLAKLNAETPAPTEPEQAPATETPAPTPDVQPQVTPPSETASTEPASESPSEPEAFEVAAAGGKTYAAAEVQQLATVVARTHGADLVKGKIAELGGTRIADLKQEQLNALGTFLAGVK